MQDEFEKMMERVKCNFDPTKPKRSNLTIDGFLILLKNMNKRVRVMTNFGSSVIHIEGTLRKKTTEDGYRVVMTNDYSYCEFTLNDIQSVSQDVCFCEIILNLK